MTTSRRNPYLLIIVAGVMVLAPTVLLGSPTSPFLTTTTLHLNARHGTHVTQMGTPCIACHTSAPQSKDASELLLPDSATCAACHPDASCGPTLGESCTACHRGAPSSLLTEKFKHAKRTRIVFDHSAHMDLAQANCQTCHALHPDSPDDHDPSLPGMQTCIGCHPHQEAWESDTCVPCHLRTKEGTILVTAPGPVLTPAAWMHGSEHDGAWVTNHATQATNRPGFCKACHTNMDCATCHAGQVKPASIHPGDWIQFHPVASALGSLRCSSCHSYQHFCITCHRKAGVAWDSPTTLGVPAGDVFHPPGWYSLSGESKHAKQAKKNLSGCVSCHTESDCITCHSATATVPVSPHPPPESWLSKCKTLAAKNPTVCLKCHTHVAEVCL